MRGICYLVWSYRKKTTDKSNGSREEDYKLSESNGRKKIIYWRERYIKEENWIGKTGFQILWFQRRGKNNDWTSSAVKESFLLTRKSLRAVPSFCVWILWYRLVMRSEHPLDVWRPAILKYWKWTVFCGERVHYRYFTRFDLMHISYYWVTEAGSGGT